MTTVQHRLGFFNARLEQRINQMGLSIRELAQSVGTSYEHIRKLIGGACLPSDEVVDRLCSVLNLSQKEMARRVQKDKLVFRFGATAWKICGIDPRLAPFYILFPLLSSEERKHFVVCMRAVVEAKSKRSGR